MNNEVKHTFLKGMKSDPDNQGQGRDSYEYGLNGRIFIKDNTLSFTSIKGTIEKYNNPKIAKYLGAFSFHDQIIVFAKCTGVDINIGGIIYETVEIDVTVAKNFDIELQSGSFQISNQISNNSFETTYTETIAKPAPPTEIDIEDNYAPDGSSDEEIDYDSYYKLNINVPNFGSCEITDQSIPDNNKDFSDCIITLQYDDQGVLYENFIWAGYQNWPLDGKIVALGVDENTNYRRVKYTDFVNPFRSVNTKDAQLYKRAPKELNNFQSTILLRPRIKAVEDKGQLKAMAVMYLYRLITANGQVTEFSPTSEVVYIYDEKNGVIEGGEQSENTTKSVVVQCNIANPSGFNQIEAIAVEYEVNGAPTSIKQLGVKDVADVVLFDHFGTESEFNSDLTIDDLTNVSANWKYCSDLSTKNNKLYASALRNDPITVDFNRLRNNFALHGWRPNGTTHETLINPEPETFTKFPATYTGKLLYVKKRVYNSIKIFNSSTVSLVNKDTGDQLTTMITSSGEVYKEQLEAVKDWLLDIQANDANFDNYYPNLTIEEVETPILFKRTSESTKTDLSKYVLTFSNSQVIQDFQEETEFDTTSKSSYNLIDGALSAGFNDGIGARVSYRMVQEEIMTKSTSRYNGGEPPINFKNPSFKKTFMKGEIYRLFIQFYREGQRIFAIPLGDLKIPELGSTYQYLDDSGNPIISSDKYVNTKIVGNKMYGMRVEIKFEVRLDCDLSKDIDMYQILYVERTENNRTILAQGISAPLLRLQDPNRITDRVLEERMRKKWMLPFYGGPVYDKVGFDEYDAFGGEYDIQTDEMNKRIIHDRSLMYFDSPDFIFGTTSEDLIDTCKLEVIAKLNQDDPYPMSSGEDKLYNGETIHSKYPREVFPKFSRKILSKNLKHTSDIDEWPLVVNSKGPDSDWNLGTHFINVSVFSKETPYRQTYEMDNFVSLERGEVIPGGELGTKFDLSNNAMCTMVMSWYYSDNVRFVGYESGQYRYEVLGMSNISFGERTLFIRSQGDLFNDTFVGPKVLASPEAGLHHGGTPHWTIYDTTALINLKRNISSSIYGGRSEQAYSKNIAIPLSETIPVDKQNNGAQSFNVEGDMYLTLYLRTKNSWGDMQNGQEPGREFNNGRGRNSPEEGDLAPSMNLNGAWAYGVVLETFIEPKLTDEYEFYREEDNIDFSLVKREVLNPAYLQINDLKRYLPQPFNYKDDPDLSNIVAASETKLSGQYYDAWSSFPVNEFQELDKNGGAVLNLAKFKDDIYAIQENQESLLHIDRDTMIPSSDGTAINLKQGAGKSIDGYTVVGNYGTSIRRSIVETDDFNFFFIDERKRMLMNFNKPITIEALYHHDFYNKLLNDPLVDADGFFDSEYEEVGIRMTLASGEKTTIVYSPIYKLLNGFYEYKNDIFINFNSELFAPITQIIEVEGKERPISQSLHQLNRGEFLNLFGEQKELQLKFVTSLGPNLVGILAHIAMVLETPVHVHRINCRTKQNMNRTILGTHRRYKIREGIHSVPTLNYWSVNMDNDEKKDLRSEWFVVELILPYSEGKKHSIFEVVNYIRNSYQ